ncbi:MAG: excinuclease ABC subunit C [SAR86 cluster bacterium]|uniref:UvrABC system protein C n=1 Tax=SAR86 cluster bacterium TaxID=2030880 RepID=A0A2A5AVK5_9GAMM|nr:MAG: excinuclease ABC subunit C [SAR86 cluster bacterium]
MSTQGTSNIAPKFDHKDFLSNLTGKPGVYRMMDKSAEVIYVGKARNLKNRVGSYFRASGLASKTIAMVNKIENIEITVTNSETEALLLEQTLIKTHRPTYNIQMRDDKSYPYIMLSEDDDYPRLSFYRGSRKRKGRFFGPYPSAHSTREALQVLQKVFKVRQCEDSYFKNRSRPCLQYQIDRCTAPCVNAISSEAYASDVSYSVLFLQGKSNALSGQLTANMEKAADKEDFERAAVIRDQLKGLRRIQEQQVVTNQGDDADIVAADIQGSYVCVHVVYVRGGRIIGSKSFYPRFRLANDTAQLLAAFLSQSYLGDDKAPTIPGEIIVPTVLEDADTLRDALSYVAGRKIKLSMRVRGHRARWLHMAVTNASESLQAFVSNKQNIVKRFQQLQDYLKLESMPSRIECFDISHTSGEGTVGSCVVFDESGAVKSDYRRYNIKGITGGDDYAAMEQVLDRRFTRLAKGEAKIPDILLIDGGKGQLTQARKIMQKFQLPEIHLLGIAKGISRRAGQETIFLDAGDHYKEIAMPTESGALHLLQQVRDEAHRFAITGHRQRRAKARKQSLLEQIPGLGPKRRRELLRYFGGQQEIKRASEIEIAKVTGISKTLAENIYEYLHSS